MLQAAGAAHAQDLHAELLQTAAELREVTRAELNQAQLLRQTEAQLDERREVLLPTP